MLEPPKETGSNKSALILNYSSLPTKYEEWIIIISYVVRVAIFIFVAKLVIVSRIVELHHDTSVVTSLSELGKRAF